MPMSAPHLSAGIAACLCAGFVTAAAQEVVLDHDYRERKGTSVKIESIVGTLARAGALPYRVTIRNSTNTSRTWTLYFEEGGSWRSLNYETIHRIEVPAGSSVTSTVIVPVPPAFTASSGYRPHSYSAVAEGFDPVRRSNSVNAGEDWPVLAMSRTLARRNLIPLGERKEELNHGDQPFGSSFDPSHLPADWRGYSALDVLLLDEESWKGLATGVRQAILEWVRLGGRCDIFSTDPSFDPGLPGAPVSAPARQTRLGWRVHSLSLGEIRAATWNGEELPRELVNHYHTVHRLEHSLARDYGKGWPLFARFGERRFNVLIVFLLLFGFAVIVAPVNLFVLARPGRRHRLFLTTPLISLGAVVVMATIILLQDGFGGIGMRVALADLQAGGEERRLYLTQEQVTRTGLVFETGFSQQETIEIAPVSLPESRWNPLSRDRGSLGDLRFSGSRYEGDFFRSRNDQGYRIRAALPARARLEFRGETGDGAPPDLFSSLGYPVEKMIVNTSGGVFVMPEGTRADPGTPVPLEPGGESATSRWISKHSRLLSESLREQVEDLGKEPGRWFALATTPGDLLLDTKEAIRWKTEAVILTGVVPELATATSPAP